MAIVYTLSVMLVVLSLMLIIGIYKHTKLNRNIRQMKKELNLLTEFNSDIVKINTEPGRIKPEMTDLLTGLPDRSVFEERVNKILEQHRQQEGTCFVIMALDIDNLSKINRLGPNIGDKLLQELSRRLQATTRQVDTITRFAGGYFLFLLPIISRPEAAMYLAQRIQDNLQESFIIDNHEVTVTVSIGIAAYPMDGSSTDVLIKNAHHAMRQAKAAGKNVYRFYRQELHELGKRELSIAKLLRSTELFNQLTIQYKTFFNTDTNQPIYIQATPLLNHPEHGSIAFSTIKDIAENSGRMHEINEWLLEKAISQLAIWSKAGLQPSQLGIPVTMRQLEHSHFVARITQLSTELNKLAIELVLEISDDRILQNSFYINKLFTLLKEAKIKIAISVLALGNFASQKIGKIPLHYLKIDTRILTNNIPRSNSDIILNQIVKLANDSNIIVMAESVDNEAQKARLLHIGCRMMEGKIFQHLINQSLRAS